MDEHAADRYRRYAHECVEEAKQLPPEQQGGLLLKANQWLKLALQAISVDLAAGRDGRIR